MKKMLDERTITRGPKDGRYEVAVRLYKTGTVMDKSWTVEVTRRGSVVGRYPDLPSETQGRLKFNNCVNSTRQGYYDW